MKIIKLIGGFFAVSLSSCATISDDHSILDRLEDTKASIESMSDFDKLREVNLFFNTEIPWYSDEEVWGTYDYWASPTEFMTKMRGDCEDFSIAKYATLIDSGIEEDKLRLIYVKAEIDGVPNVAHMVLGYYYDDNNDPYILDNNLNSIVRLSKRNDLDARWTFNERELWVGDSTTADNSLKMDPWRDVLVRMKSFKEYPFSTK